MREIIMDGTNPKVSFIPKGSLVREESFLERRRPQSAIGFIAFFAFVLAISTYAGLYYYNDKLNQEVATKTIAIKRAQKEFSDEPKVGEAKVFRARADLAMELLNAHTVVSPVFAFLSENTTESILYNRFSFKNGADGATLELSGEAPTYGALAYQTDVLRGKTKELSKFSVSNIALTKFGTVTFNIAMSFVPNYLLYTNNLSKIADSVSQLKEPPLSSTPIINVPLREAPEANKTSISSSPALATTTPILSTTPAEQSIHTEDIMAGSLANDWKVAPRALATTSVAVKTEGGWQSVLRSLWLKFKFW